MSDGAAKPLNVFSWWAGPLFVALGASLVLAMPLKIYGLQLPEPVFPLVLAFSWGVIRTSAWPSVGLMVAGLVLDCLWGSPLGLWALCLLAAYAVVFALRPILSGGGFWALWFWYLAASVAAFLTGLILMGFKTGHLPSLVGVFWQLFASVMLFPFAWRLVERYEDADVRFR